MEPWPIKRRALQLVTPTPEDASATLFGWAGNFLRQAGLADACLPGQHHHTPPPCDRVVQGGVQHGRFSLAAEKNQMLNRFCWSNLRTTYLSWAHIGTKRWATVRIEGCPVWGKEDL